MPMLGKKNEIPKEERAKEKKMKTVILNSSSIPLDGMEEDSR